MKKKYSLLLLIIIIAACSKEDEIAPLQAIIADVQPGQVGESLTLDGSSSKGLDRASVEWIYNGGPQGDLSFDKSSAITSFIPQKTGSYSFTLRLTSGSEFSEASIGVTVSGSIELTSLSSSQFLEDINGQTGEGSDPDYIINSVITVPSGTTITLNGADIAFGPDAGLIVEGSIVGATSTYNSLASSGTSSWKGIFIETGGQFSFQDAIIVISGGGSSSLSDDPDEKSTLLVAGNASFGSNCVIKNSEGYGVYLTSSGNLGYSYLSFENNTNTMRMPYHKLGSSPLQNLILSGESATARIELYGIDGNTLQTTASIFNVSAPIYIESDMEVIGSSAGLTIQNAELRFADGIGLKMSGTAQFNSVVFTGQTESPGAWKGIYLGESNSGHVFNSCTVQYAGGSAFETASGPAGIYQSATSSSSNIQNSTISNNLGIGLINDGFIAAFNGNTFSDNALAHARINISELHKIGTNTFSSDVPAIELQKQFGGVVSSFAWPSLGGDNYYLCKVNIDASTIVLPAGLHVKFDVNTYFNITGALTVQGTESDPVLLEGAVGNNGDWIGVGFSSTASIDYLTIKNAGRAGGTSLFSTPFDANLTVMSHPSLNVSITNSTITNSSGYGVLVKQGAGVFNITDVGSNNVLAGDLGDFYDAN